VGDPADLVPVTAVTPANAAAGIDPSGVEFQFVADADPSDTYIIEIDEAPTFATPLTLTAGPADSYVDQAGQLMVHVTADLQANTFYFWRVANQKAEQLKPGFQAACGRTAHVFSTGEWQIQLEGPKGPGHHPWALGFDWKNPAGVAKYEFELYKGPDLATDLEWQDTVIAPPYVLDVRINRDYWWRIRAVTQQGEAGQWTSLEHFQTTKPVGELLTPLDSAEVYPWGIGLTWKSVKGAAAYRLALTDYPECFVDGAPFTIQVLEALENAATVLHQVSFQPTWDGQHLHCWKMRPLGPKLFGTDEWEEGDVSATWKIKTKDHETLPGSVAPMDRVVDPEFWDERAKYLLFPSAVGGEEVHFQWKGVPEATSYSVEVFPILGETYSPDKLVLLVGNLPYVPAAPGIVGQDPPTEWVAWPLTLLKQYFSSEPNFVYGFWYRVIAHGPDGTKSPSPPWSQKAPACDLPFTAEDQALVPLECAPLVPQTRPQNSGVLLLRPTPVKIASLSQGPDAEMASQATVVVELAGQPDGAMVWNPWHRYKMTTCPGGDDVSNVLSPFTDAGQTVVQWQDTIGYAPKMNVRMEPIYTLYTGEYWYGDPADFWADSPFAGTDEAASFVVKSECAEIELKEPDNFGASEDLGIQEVHFPVPNPDGTMPCTGLNIDHEVWWAEGPTYMGQGDMLALFSAVEGANGYEIRLRRDDGVGGAYGFTVSDDPSDKEWAIFELDAIWAALGDSLPVTFRVDVRPVNTTTGEYGFWSNAAPKNDNRFVGASISWMCGYDIDLGAVFQNFGYPY
jgi:hypothetical protein